MSEWKPSTNDIRDAVRWSRYVTITPAEFDEWLTSVKTEAVRQANSTRGVIARADDELRRAYFKLEAGSTEIRDKALRATVEAIFKEKL